MKYCKIILLVGFLVSFVLVLVEKIGVLMVYFD